MRKLLILAAAFGLIATGCGGDSAGSCADVADEAIVLFQEFLNEASSMTEEDFISGGEAMFEDFEAKGEKLDEQISDLGCSDEEMDSLMAERVGGLDAGGPLGELLLSEIGEDFLE